MRGFPEDRQGHSRNHVEEGRVREPNKRKDGTFQRDVCDAPLHTNMHSTSWRFDLVSPWRLDHPSSQQDTDGTLGPLRRNTVGGSTSRPRARDTRHRHEMGTRVTTTRATRVRTTQAWQRSKGAEHQNQTGRRISRHFHPQHGQKARHG